MLAALLLAACVPLTTYTPTPVLFHDAVPDADLAGYSLYYRLPGGTWQLLRDLPCEYDAIEYGAARVCRGVDTGDALQRYCATCAPFTAYEFSVKAYDRTGNRSVDYSNVVSVCFSPVCVKPGPCT